MKTLSIILMILGALVLLKIVFHILSIPLFLGLAVGFAAGYVMAGSKDTASP